MNVSQKLKGQLQPTPGPRFSLNSLVFIKKSTQFVLEKRQFLKIVKNSIVTKRNKISHLYFLFP